MLDIDVEILKRAGQNLKDISYEILAAKSNMDSVSDEIKSAWNSQYTDKYIQIYEEIANGVEITMKRTEELGNMIDEIADRIIQTEDNIGEIMSQ